MGVDVARDRALARRHASAHLGGRLRSLLIEPSVGFAGALAFAQRRAEARRSLPEGALPYVLAAVGGIGLVLAWLKVGGLFDLRHVRGAQFRWSYLVAAALGGALLALLAQLAWAAPCAAALRSMGATTRARGLRIVWGAACVPQLFALLLVPADVLISGKATFTTVQIGGTVETAWTALSVGVALSLALWTFYLLGKGVRVASGLGAAEVVLSAVLALLCTTLVVAGVIVAVQALDKVAR